MPGVNPHLFSSTLGPYGRILRASFFSRIEALTIFILGGIHLPGKFLGFSELDKDPGKCVCLLTCLVSNDLQRDRRCCDVSRNIDSLCTIDFDRSAACARSHLRLQCTLVPIRLYFNIFEVI